MFTSMKHHTGRTVVCVLLDTKPDSGTDTQTLGVGDCRNLQLSTAIGWRLLGGCFSAGVPVHSELGGPPPISDRGSFPHRECHTPRAPRSSLWRREIPLRGLGLPRITISGRPERATRRLLWAWRLRLPGLLVRQRVAAPLSPCFCWGCTCPNAHRTWAPCCKILEPKQH